MPIKVVYVKRKRKWAVKNVDTNHIFGWHPTETKARAQWDIMKKNGVDMEGKGGKLPRTKY